MRRKMSNMLVAVFLLSVVSFAFTFRIYSSDLQPVEEGERGGLSGQHESLQAYSYSEPPETEWNKTYGGAYNEYLGCIIQTTDGGYAIAGYTRSYGAGGSDFWLITTDAFGNVQLNKTYGREMDDWACSVVQTIDGGYALLGTTASFGDTTGDFWLVKVDQFGNEQWNKTYSKAPRWDIGRSMAYTSDGGFLLAGDAEWLSYPWSQAWLIKTNSTGDKEWDYTYGQELGYRSTYAWSVIEASDGNYTVAGVRYPNLHCDLWLFKIDRNGNMLWHKTYGDSDRELGNSLVETYDGGYAIAGHTRSFGAGGYDIWLVKTDASGNKEWDRLLALGTGDMNKGFGVAVGADDGYAVTGWSMDKQLAIAVKTDKNGIELWTKTWGPWMGAIDVELTLDGGYILAGVVESDFWLVKIDASGSQRWIETFEGPESELAVDVELAPNGGYVVAGYTNSFGAGGFDFWLIRFKVHDITVTQIKPCRNVVGQGYSVSMNVTLGNQGDYTETFNLTVYANATVIGFLTNIALTSGSSTTITFTWTPSASMKGNYTISAYAWPVLSETDKTDNLLIDGYVRVSIPGDINGDGAVDGKDSGMLGLHWPPQPYDANCDINGDGVIDGKDSGIMGLNWGKTDP